MVSVLGDENVGDQGAAERRAEQLLRAIVDGTAELLDASGVTATTGGNPTDMAMSHDGRYLYARVANLRAIAIFRIGHDGRLDPLPSLVGTPAGLAGLAGF